MNPIRTDFLCELSVSITPRCHMNAETIAGIIPCDHTQSEVADIGSALPSQELLLENGNCLTVSCL